MKQSFFAVKLVASSLALGWMLKSAGAKGFETDVQTFWSWSNTLATVGIREFYAKAGFCDYQPLYLYVLWVVGRISQTLQLNYGSYAGLLVLKSPAILAHTTLLGMVLYFQKAQMSWFGRDERSVRSLCLFLALAFSPALTYNAATWGQVDTVFNLLLIIATIVLLKQRMVLAGVLYAALFCFKPHALFFLPVVGLAFLRMGGPKDIGRELARFALAFFITAFCMYIPFWGFNVAGIVGQYRSTLSSYAYASLNAFNIYMLYGWNWKNLADKTPMGVSVGTICISSCVIVTLSLCTAFFQRVKKIKIRSLSDDAIVAVGCCLAFTAFLFAPKMHERYSLPTLGLMTLLIFRNQRFFLAYLLLSFTTFINQDMVIDHFFGLRRPLVGPVVTISVLMNVVAWLIMCSETCRILVGQEDRSFQTFFDAKAWLDRMLSDLRGIRPFALTTNDRLYLAVLLITGLIVNFYNLGNHSTPRLEHWKAREKIIKFEGKPNALYFYGFTDHDGSLVVTCKGQQAVTRAYQAAAALNWQTIPLGSDCTQEVSVRWQGERFIEVGEVILKDHDHVVAPIELCDQTSCKNPTDDAWFDEQHFASDVGSYVISTIFDEVYYARSVVELSRGIFPFESTHPPLGKLIGYATSLFAKISPAQWRFHNAAFGIFIPLLLFFLLRQLGFTRPLAWTGAALSLLDSMRVSLSRLYTIDMPVAVFILLSMIFGLRYLDTCLKQKSNMVRSRSIMWTSIAIGLAIATKWNAAFALFTVLILCIGGIYIFARSTNERKAWFHLGFLVVIPVGIYALAYLPYRFLLKTGFTFTELLENQKNMYMYHSTLTATHPFQSKWYTWPFVQVPVWEHVNKTSSGTETLTMIGNPLIWWSILISIFVLSGRLTKRFDAKATLCLGIFALQFLPWIIASRATFIYHFFVPSLFGITLLIACYDGWPHQYKKTALYAYLCAVAIVFAVFAPIYLGIKASDWYLEHMVRWFETWSF